ncbi:MAG TPA: hypothetical protein VMV92_02575 [Streptosporangiaceae bacterium]|nr:hypothetical protein [Streptosporangiaceae bacterium]
MGTDVGNEARAEPDQRVVVLDRHLDPDDVDVWCRAAAVLLVAAEEVGVLGAARVDGVLDDQPLGDAGLLAPAAKERALEVVVVDPAALPGSRAGLDDVLDALEEVLVDERLVPSVDLLAFVGDDAEVVPVAEHERQFVD